jgi:hypothetical protein
MNRQTETKGAGPYLGNDTRQRECLNYTWSHDW